MNAQGARGIFAETRTDQNLLRSLYRKRQQRDAAKIWADYAPKRTVDRFTGLLEQDLPLYIIASRMRIGEAKTDCLFARVCRESGSQAR